MNIAIIDYEVSNLYSIQNALNFIGINNYITNDREKYGSALAMKDGYTKQLVTITG